MKIILTVMLVLLIQGCAQEAVKEDVQLMQKSLIPSDEIKYPNGDFYKGANINQQRHGFGKMTYANGDV